MKSLTRIIQKIFYFASENIKSHITKVIFDRKRSEFQKLNDLVKLVKPYYKEPLIKSANRQSYITDKLYKKFCDLDIDIHDNINIADIGGGNGNTLSLLREKNTALSNENLYCVEDKKWVEEYSFDKDYIQYIFWDFHTINIPDNKVDVILIMVSLHHMKDSTIENVLTEIKRFAKNGAYVFVKEHDANETNRTTIIWEHHLYHILDIIKYDRTFDYKAYTENNILNFKSMLQWHMTFRQYGFVLIDTLNRFLELDKEHECKNPTDLYWSIYRVHK